MTTPVTRQSVALRRASVLALALTSLLLALLAGTASAQQDNFLTGNGSITGTTTFGNATYVPNAVAPVSGAVPQGAMSLTRGTIRNGSGGTGGIHNVGFADNRLVMVYQSNGLAATPIAGDQSAVTLSSSTAGHWEFARISTVSGATLNFTAPLIYSYPSGTTQVIAVPEYVNVTLSNANTRIDAQPWDGSSGGVLVMLATGQYNFSGNGAQMRAEGLGFRGAVGWLNNPTEAKGATNCPTTQMTGNNGLGNPMAFKGEGFWATGYKATSPATDVNQTGRGNFVHAAGGGNCFNAAGGGGGNAGQGGNGGNTLDGTSSGGGVGDDNRPGGGLGGAVLNYSPTAELPLGGGGGAGDRDDANNGPGADGGGVVYVRGATMTGRPRMTANGANAAFADNGSPYDGAGGGGAGGVVVARMTGAVTCTTSFGGSWMRARGGTGGSNYSNSSFSWTVGGGGGGGRVYLQSQAAPSGNCQPSSTGGARGTTGRTDGAQNGGNGTAASSIVGMAKPTVNITSPTGSPLTNDNTPTISGTGTGTTAYIYADNVLIGTAPISGGTWSFTPGATLSDGGHTITVHSRSADGIDSDMDSESLTVDTIAPAMAITAPANGLVTSDNTPTVTYTASDLHLGANSQCSVDGGAWANCTSGSSLPTLADGAHTIQVRNTDLAGNTGASTTHNFTVDTAAPTVTLNTPANGGVYNTPTPPLSFSVSDANPGATSQCSIDGGAWSACTSGSNLSSLSEGSHTIQVRNIDQAGNVGSSATHTFTVDLTAPETTIDSNPPAVTSQTSATFTFSSDEPGSTFECRLDGGAWGACSSGHNYPGPLTEGSHTFEVRATDPAGNTDPTPDSYTWTVDTTDPVVAISGPSITTDSTPLVNGTTDQPDGSTVTLKNSNGDTLCTATVSSGAWSCTVSGAFPLSEGPNTLTAETSDLAGNTGTDTHVVTLDTTDPVVAISGPSITTDSTPLVNGTTDQPDGSTVTLKNSNGDTLCTATVSSGAWSCTVSGAFPLSEGPNTLTAETSDLAGNTGTDSHVVTLDTTDPVVAISGPSITTDSTPLVNGTTDQPNGSTVTLKNSNGDTLCTATVSSGAWSCTVSGSFPLSEGPNTLTAETSDLAGNTGTDSHVVTLDTTDPVVAISGPSITTDSTPLVNGTTDQPDGSTVTLKNSNGDTLCTATVSSGAWSCTVSGSFPLSEGPNTLTAETSDLAGNTGTDSHVVTLDTTDPVVAISGPSITTDSTPLVNGTTDQPDGSTVTLKNSNGDTLCTATVSSGAWSCTVSGSFPLSEGPNTLTAETSDLAGNTGTDTHVVTLDTTDPVVNITGPAAPVDDTTPTISGTTDQPDGSTVTVKDPLDNVLCTATVSSGAWSCESSVLPEGPTVVTAETTDPAGNTGSDTHTVTVDTTDPAIAITGPTQPTNDQTPAITGTTDQPDGSTVTVKEGLTTLCTTTASGGTWSCSPSSNMSEGTHSITAETTDEAGNTATAVGSVEIDLTDPVVNITGPAAPVDDTTPTISGTTDQPDGSTVTVKDPLDNVLCTATVSSGAWSCESSVLPEGPTVVTAETTDPAGNTGSDTHTVTVDTTDPAIAITGPTQPTNDQTPAITGTTDQPDGSTVTVKEGLTTLCTTTASGGTWSCSPSSNMSEGTHSITAETTDEAGNTATAVGSVEIDLTDPVVNITGPAAPVDDTTPTISGTTDQPDGSTVTVKDPLDNVLCTATVSSGAWSCESSVLPEGPTVVTAETTDPAGNTGSDTHTVTVDTTDPAIAITGPTQPTNDQTPAITGTTDQPDGSTVTVKEGLTTLCTTTASGGTWSCSPSSNMSEGTHSITAETTDEAGNTATAVGSVEIDLTDPVVNITGPAAPVDDTTPTISGTTDQPDGSTVTVKDPLDNVLCTATVSSGAWSCESSVLPEGPTVVTAETTDPAGNTGSDTHTVTVDTTDPAIAITGPTQPTNDQTPAITGTTDQPDGSTVTVKEGLTTLCTTTASGGTWSCSPSSNMSEGTHSITAETTDEAGNTATAVGSVEIDLTDPVVNITGPAAPVDDTTPTISGTTDQPDGSTVTVKDPLDNVLCTATVSSGAWSCESSVLPEGPTVVTAETTDPAGNTGSDTHTVTVDTTDPAIAITGPTQPTNDQTPAITGTTDQPDGSTVTVKEGLTTLCTTTASGGTWSCSPSSNMSEGTHSITAETTDEAGNTATAVGSVEIDLTDPVVNITGPAAPVDDTTPTISGTTDQPDGSTVTVKDPLDNVLCTATVSSGAWSCESSVLPEGPTVVTAETTDPAGNTGSDTHTVTVDTTDPAIAITGPTQPTNDQTPAITGTTDQPDGSTVTVKEGLTTLCTTTASGGTWSCSPSSNMSEGTHSITAETTDEAGNTATAVGSVEIDLTDPVVNITGPAAPVDDTTPTISGTTDQPDGSTVTVKDPLDNVLCTATVSSGAWSCESSVLPEGPTVVTAETTDPAGNTGSDTHTVTVDTTDPAIAITGPTQPTNDQTPAITGTTDQPDGSTVTVKEGLTTLCTTTASGGTWSCSPSSNMSEGTHSITAETTDEAGNTATAVGSVEIDLTDPVVNITGPAAPVDDTTPTISGTTDQPDGSTVTVKDPLDNVLCTATVSSGAWSCESSVLPEGPTVVTAETTDPAGNTGSDTHTVTVDTTDPAIAITGPTQPTNDQTPAITGTTDQPDGSTVTVKEGLTTLCTTTASGGTWSCSPSSNMSEGTHSITAETTDEAGNTATAVGSVEIDLTDPVVNISGPAAPVDDTTPTISGTTDQPDGSTVTVKDPLDNVLCTATVSSGAWSCESSVLPEGPTVVTAETTDPAGNTGSDTHTVTVDTTDPAIAITGPSLTADSTPLVNGTTDQPDGSTVTLKNSNGDTLCTATVSSGAWSCTVSGAFPLSEGANTLTAETTDTAGNTGTDSHVVTLDTTAPPAPTITGPVGGSTVTISRPPITGTGEPGATITVTEGSTTICTAVAAGDGSWSCTPTSNMPDGPHTITATAEDQAGNESGPSAPVTFTIDTTPPNGNVVKQGPSEPTAENPTFDLSSDDPLATTTCSLDGAPATPCSSPYTPTGTLAPGTHTLVVTWTDPNGNSSQKTIVFVIASGSDPLPAACFAKGITITDLAPSGSKVTMRGFARKSYVGQTVTVKSKLDKKLKATGVVQPDGSFLVKFKAPKKALWNTNKALYNASVGTESTKWTKLLRRVATATASYSNGKLTVKGALVKPLFPKAKATVTAKTGCVGKMNPIGTAKISSSGKFSANIDMPGASGVIFVRVKAVVSKGGKKPKPLTTYSYLIPVILGK